MYIYVCVCVCMCIYILVFTYIYNTYMVFMLMSFWDADSNWYILFVDIAMLVHVPMCASGWCCGQPVFRSGHVPQDAPLCGSEDKQPTVTYRSIPCTTSEKQQLTSFGKLFPLDEHPAAVLLSNVRPQSAWFASVPLQPQVNWMVHVPTGHLSRESMFASYIMLYQVMHDFAT